MGFSTRNIEPSLASMRSHKPLKVRESQREFETLTVEDIEDAIDRLNDECYEGWRLELAEECLKARRAPTITPKVNITIIKPKTVLNEPTPLSLPFTYNPGFSRIEFPDGRIYKFAKRQSKIIEYLVKHTTKPDRQFVPKSKVMEDLGTPTSDWKNAFLHNKEARDAVIEEDEKQKEVRIRL